jgi:hypothetical protein
MQYDQFHFMKIYARSKWSRLAFEGSALRISFRKR